MCMLYAPPMPASCVTVTKLVNNPGSECGTCTAIRCVHI
jgi:hypothetical protein